MILGENPHIKFFNNLRGYVRCRVAAEEWRSDYRVVPFVDRRGAEVSTRASFVIEDGSPGLQKVGGAAVSGAKRRSRQTEATRLRAQELAR